MVLRVQVNLTAVGLVAGLNALHSLVSGRCYPIQLIHDVLLRFQMTTQEILSRCLVITHLTRIFLNLGCI